MTAKALPCVGRMLPILSDLVFHDASYISVHFRRNPDMPFGPFTQGPKLLYLLLLMGSLVKERQTFGIKVFNLRPEMRENSTGLLGEKTGKRFGGLGAVGGRIFRGMG